ncbi:MAG: hypothetical protein ACKVKF_01760 [Rhodobacterales bacterium]|nr:hypothetical protein [Puniceibacterium antarcticum]
MATKRQDRKPLLTAGRIMSRAVQPCALHRAWAEGEEVRPLDDAALELMIGQVADSGVAASAIFLLNA